MSANESIRDRPWPTVLRFTAIDALGPVEVAAISRALRDGVVVEMRFVSEDLAAVFTLRPFHGAIHVVDRHGHVGTFASVEAAIRDGWLSARFW